MHFYVLYAVVQQIEVKLDQNPNSICISNILYIVHFRIGSFSYSTLCKGNISYIDNISYK